MIIKRKAFLKGLGRVLLALSFALVCSILVSPIAFADDAMTFSVTLPSSLPIEVDSENNVITPEGLAIKNNKSGPIAISSIKIRPVNGWKLSDYGTDYTKKAIDIKEYGLKLAGKEVPEDGNADLSGIPFIEGMSEYSLVYDASVSIQSQSISCETIGEVLITVGWREGQIYSLSITKPPNKQTYFSTESFDPTGMEVTATYYGGEREVLTDYEIVNGTNLSVGQTGVTIRHTNDDGSTKSAVCPVNVCKQLSAIKITSAPDKTSYEKGESFNPSGMTVEAVYADGTTKVVDSYVYSPSVLNVSTDAVSISYSENGITRSAKVPVTIKKNTNIADAEVILSRDAYDYDGSEKRPDVLVVLDGVTLKEGRDYTLTFRDNINVGTAKATVSGIGNYSGERTKEFSIKAVKPKLTVTWSDTTLVCNNSTLAPVAQLSGLKGGDAATLTVNGAARAPGTYTASAEISFTSGNAADYEIVNGTCQYEIVPGDVPTLLPGAIRNALINAGVKEVNSTVGVSITEIKPFHEPDGSELYSVVLDAEGSGKIMGYVYMLGYSGSDSRYRLVISGNGAGSIKCNADSYEAFSDLARNYNGGHGNFTGLEMLDMSGIVNAGFMFSVLQLGDFAFPRLYFPNAESLNNMFYRLSARNLSFAAGLYAPKAKQALGMLQRLTIEGTFDISGFNTSNLENFKSMFASAQVNYLDLNTFDMSSAKIIDNMFVASNINTLKINSWNVESVQSCMNMFVSMQGTQYINISAWNPKSVTTTMNMFSGMKSVKSVYCPVNWASCTYFEFMFGDSANSLETVYASADFVTSAVSDIRQRPFANNPHFPSVTISGLKLTENGGVLTYSPGISD